MWHVWGKPEARIGFLYENPEGKRQLGIPGCRCEDIRMDIKTTVGRASTRMIRLRIGSKWQAFVNTVMNFGFYKMRGISWLYKKLSASQDGLCSMDLVIRYHQFVSSLLSVFPVNGFSSCETRQHFNFLKWLSSGTMANHLRKLRPEDNWTSTGRIFVKLHFAVLYSEMCQHTQYLVKTGGEYRYCTRVIQ